MDGWLDDVTSKLGVRPSSVDELSEAQHAVKQVEETKGEMEVLCTRISDKVKLLKQFGGNNKVLEEELTSMESQTNQKWSGLTNLLGSFNEELDAQKEALKNQIQVRIDEMHSNLSDFGQRWSVAKPRSDQSCSPDQAEAAVARISECKIEFDRLTEQVCSQGVSIGMMW